MQNFKSQINNLFFVLKVKGKIYCFSSFLHVKRVHEKARHPESMTQDQFIRVTVKVSGICGVKYDEWNVEFLL